MVAEKSGRVRIYDISSDCPLQSLDCPTPPLITADWAPSNNLVVGGVAGCSWFLWDLSQSRYVLRGLTSALTLNLTLNLYVVLRVPLLLTLLLTSMWSYECP